MIKRPFARSGAVSGPDPVSAVTMTGVTEDEAPEGPDWWNGDWLLTEEQLARRPAPLHL